MRVLASYPFRRQGFAVGDKEKIDYNYRLKNQCMIMIRNLISHHNIFRICFASILIIVEYKITQI